MHKPPNASLDERRAELQDRLDRMIPRIDSRLQFASDRLLRAYSLEDAMASCRRRLDELFMGGRIEAGDDAHLEALFRRILRNRIIDEVRKEARRRAAETEAARAAAAGSAVTVDSAAQTLAEVLAHLRTDERSSLELRARGMNSRRVADELRLPYPTYRSRWRRLRDRLARVAPACRGVDTSTT